MCTILCVLSLLCCMHSSLYFLKSPISKLLQLICRLQVSYSTPTVATCTVSSLSVVLCLSPSLAAVADHHQVYLTTEIQYCQSAFSLWPVMVSGSIIPPILTLLIFLSLHQQLISLRYLSLSSWCLLYICLPWACDQTRPPSTPLTVVGSVCIYVALYWCLLHVAIE